ncbi:MAG: flippase-like domain-containing protein [Deltaproteobacteria bacterium]|nr:flippase-like domain-containing protein [Deltaproteobacteria bacterium]
MRKNLLKTLIGLAIGAFFVWLSAKDWPYDKLVGPVSLEAGHLVVGNVAVPEGTLAPEALATMDGWAVELVWFLPFLAILALIHVLRVVRWRPLLDPIVKLDFTTHNRIGAVGFMAMFLFPLRLGELVRPFLVKRAAAQLPRSPGADAEPRVRMTAVLATVVVERIVDGLVVTLCLFAVMSFLPGSSDSASELRVGAWAALAVFAGAALLLAGARWQAELTRKVVHKTAGLVSKRLAHAIDSLLESFLSGLRRLPNARAFAGFIAITIVYWGLNGLGVWCMVQAFHLPIDMVGAYAMMACVVVGMMIPNSPGNVGSFWYFLLLPVALYGVGNATAQAIAFGLSVWLCQLVQQTAFGLWFVVRGKVSWKGVVAATYEDESTLAAPLPAEPLPTEPAESRAAIS